MKSKVANITTIRTGLFVKPLSIGDTVYLQSRHFHENGRLRTDLHPDLNKNDFSENHLLKPGDVLFAAKGSKNFAAVYEAHNHPAVASTTFFVLRLITDKIYPEYLAWFLNTSFTQQILKKGAFGTSIVSIPKTVLGDLEIFMPSLQKQKAILQIHQLDQQEQHLLNKLSHLKQQYIESTILKEISR